jgi:hypothetical protein
LVLIISTHSGLEVGENSLRNTPLEGFKTGVGVKMTVGEGVGVSLAGVSVWVKAGLVKIRKMIKTKTIISV